MKIRIGIVGYGNLGKAVEQNILSSSKYKLVAIFSRRMVSSKFGTRVEPYEHHRFYKNKIDIMFLCGGSLKDTEYQTEEIARRFDCINSFDTHSKITSHISSLEKICKETHHRAIVSCGWDPGLFSIMRAYFYKISGNIPHTFWGKGISMGHSDAIRQVDGVDDGVQFTIPNKEAVLLAKKNRLDDEIPKHYRECYVVSKAKNKSKIVEQIKNIPNYFSGYPTSVTFVDEVKLAKLKNKMIHGGEVISAFNKVNNKFSMSFKTKMSSNPDFTAKIMTCYIQAIISLKEKSMTGAFTPLDIPVSMLFEDRFKMVDKFC